MTASSLFLQFLSYPGGLHVGGALPPIDKQGMFQRESARHHSEDGMAGRMPYLQPAKKSSVSPYTSSGLGGNISVVNMKLVR